jgi:hypothetical protein
VAAGFIEDRSMEETSSNRSQLDRIEVKIDTLLAFFGNIPQITAKLKASADALAAAVAANQPKPSPHMETSTMANPIIDALTAQVTAQLTVEQSALTLINGFTARMQAAVTAALAGGATAADLAPITAELSTMQSSATALSAAVVANTPAAGP